jgi:polysaccharide export outer membrane protein
MLRLASLIRRHRPCILGLAVALSGGCTSLGGPPKPADLDDPPPLTRAEEEKDAPQRINRRMTVDERLAVLQRMIKETQARPRLGEGDVLNISVYDEPELSLSGIPIRPDGMISFPLIGDVQAAGRTVDELRTAVSHRLSQFVIEPRVSVVVQDFASLNYTISGEVVQPGVYPLTTRVSLTEAVAKAGGLKKGQFRASSVELADLSNAFIARQDRILPVDFVRLLRQGDLRFDITLQDGDYISIPSGLSKEVYIVGEVATPALFAFRERMPMSRTLALAEGFTRNADLSRVHIVRGALSNPELIIVDFNQVLKGRAQDVQLEPGDIVYVPPTTLSKWSHMLDQIVPTIQAIQTGIILQQTVSGNDNN